MLGRRRRKLGVTVFKRRKPDDPTAAVPLPAGHTDPDVASTRSSDSDLGVPAFRPAIPKEPSTMARPPFPAAPAPSGSPSGPPTGSASGPVSLSLQSGGVMAPRPGLSPAGPRLARDPAERRTLVVGRGISVQGTVQDAERLVVEGTVEATMIQATELSVAPGGMFKGEVEVEDAEIAGTIDGTLTAKGSLIVRASGKVLGTARCRRLQVEDGGQITGRMEMLTSSEPGARSSAEPAAASAS
jgi:cytoskeletal protein CcmA (bactofilin family)